MLFLITDRTEYSHERSNHCYFVLSPFFPYRLLTHHFLSHFTIVVAFIAQLLVQLIIQTNILEENLKRKPLYEITHVDVNLPPISFPLVLPDILRVFPYFVI